MKKTRVIRAFDIIDDVKLKDKILKGLNDDKKE